MSGAAGHELGGVGGETGGSCGDGNRDAGEECDDDNTENGDGCSEDCRAEPNGPVCGDGVDTGDEECDDGNLDPGDGCDSECRLERCGNERPDAGEECDPPAAGSCSVNCSFIRADCGNGELDGEPGDPKAEQCDDENDVAGDGCFECRIECGDGRIDASIGEECDKALFPAECSDDCKWKPACGDGVVQAPEECEAGAGVACEACKIKRPEPPRGCGEGGAGGAAGAGGEGGSCSESPSECVPAVPSNLLQNGNFDSDGSAWQAHSTLVSLSVVDESYSSPKSLDIAITSGTTRVISGAYQCITVQPDRRYELIARYRVPSSVPADVAASVTTILYDGPSCAGTPVATPVTGFSGTARDAWTPYQMTIDTAALAREGRLLLRLNVLRPSGASGCHLMWDDVSLTTDRGSCGDCEVGEGEACDDGNQAAGDGCSASCTLEFCGDGTRAPNEACDDGNSVFGASGDTCTPSCQTPDGCDTCSVASCADEAADCLALTGVAQAGPRKGIARSTLCDELRTCVEDSSCQLVPRTSAGVHGAFIENCYCGTAGEPCFEERGRANGTCRAELEAALESTDPEVLATRLSGNDSRYPVLRAVKDLVSCEASACGNNCVRASTCGDGIRQDRELDVKFVKDGQEVDCDDEFTPTGRGCRYEECDDTNLESGDGCDAHCLLEVCGNYLVQGDEECDDGNAESGDGCSADCLSEFECGDSLKEGPEECDPPGGEYLCTPAEYADPNRPTECACDTSCKFIVCGDGKVRRPLEECDPPNGTSCLPDCKLAPQGPCQTCISSDPELAYFDDLYCNSDPTCIELKECFIDTGCGYPVPGQCYCGPDTSSACEQSDFEPSGPCHELIAASVGPAGLPNAEVLSRMPLLEYPSGAAFAVVGEAALRCPDVCFVGAP